MKNRPVWRGFWVPEGSYNFNWNAAGRSSEKVTWEQSLAKAGSHRLQTYDVRATWRPSIHKTLCRHCLPGNFPSISSVQFSCSVVSDFLQPHGPQHARPPCPSPTPGVHPNPCPLSWWYHPAISSSVVPFSSSPQSFPASGSFLTSQLFTSGGQSIGVSASTSVLPKNIQDWFPLGWTGWISSQTKRLSRVFSNTTVQKHKFFGAQLSL